MKNYLLLVLRFFLQTHKIQTHYVTMYQEKNLHDFLGTVKLSEQSRAHGEESKRDFILPMCENGVFLLILRIAAL